jgi:hypothetical protein
MSDSFKLQQDAARGARAKQLAENELLQEAFANLEESYVAHWRATKIDDVIGREKLFLAINVVGKVRSHLTSVMTNGRLAEKELQDLAALAERKKLFGIV